MIVRYHIFGVEFDLDIDEQVVSDATILWYIKRQQLPEPEVFNTMKYMINPKDTVIDGGANIGLFTLFMSKLVGEQGKVFSFEPDPRNLKKLRRNLELNNVTNCRVYEEAIYHCTTNVHLSEPVDNGEVSIYSGESHTLLVKSIHLDCFKNQKIDFIKLDIEGAEYDAILGAAELLKLGDTSVVLELNPDILAKIKLSERAIRKKMLDYGLLAFRMAPTGHLPALIPLESDLIFEKQNSNVLFSTLEKVSRAWPKVLI